MTLSISYGDFTCDFDALPEASKLSLALGGLAHKLGNEVSAAVSGEFRKRAREAYKAEHGDQAWADLPAARKGEIEKAGIPATDTEEYTSLKADFTKAKFEAILDGSVGVREAAPRRDPFEVECDAIVQRETLDILRSNFKGYVAAFGKNGSKIPDDDCPFKFPNGERTFGELKAARFAKNRDRIEGEARKTLAARAKKAEQAKGLALDEAF